MTFDARDLVNIRKTPVMFINIRKGGKSSVTGMRTVEISSNLKIMKCVLVPTLSNKLLPVSHVTKEMNYKMMMNPNFCILHDIQTRTIIGCGTERVGLHCVNEMI